MSIETPADIKTPTPPAKAKRTPPRLLEVVKAFDLSPAMRRIILGGEDLHGFPVDSGGAHIKVFLPLAGQTRPRLPTLGPNGPIWPPRDVKPITRTYSVRKYCAIKNELTVDFVLHGDHSPAAGWAQNAKPGDFLGVAGPGGPDPLLKPAPFHVLAGDLTALPAIAALLEELPQAAQGKVFLWSPSSASRIELEHPPGVTLMWLHSSQQSCTDLMLSAVQEQLPLGWRGELSAFIGGENSMVLALRQYLCEQFGLAKGSMYATPYWRYGQDEETYHQERHRIMDQVY